MARNDATPIDEIDNDNLIYADVTDYADDTYADEITRCHAVEESLIMTGEDLTYWVDRIAIVDDMRNGLWRVSNMRAAFAREDARVRGES